MREIKFRGLNKCGMWCIGYYSHEVFRNDESSIIMDNHVIVHYDENQEMTEDVIRRETLGQIVGNIDHAGNNIYEGDILKTIDNELMVVGWNEKYASFVLDRKGWAFSHWFGESCDPDDCEIIGNIHQNPDLLQ